MRILENTIGVWRSGARQSLILGDDGYIVANADSEKAQLLASAEDLLEALKPFSYLAEVMEEGQMLNFRGVYVSWEDAKAAKDAVVRAMTPEEA